MGVEEVFGPLLGSWTGLEEQRATPWSAAGPARAAITFRRDLAGTAVVQDYRQVRADGDELLAHGVFLLDPAGEQVLWWLFDSDGQPPEPARGAWRGPELTLTRVTVRGVARHRFVVDGDRLDYQVELGTPDPGTSPFLQGRYRRVSGH